MGVIAKQVQNILKIIHLVPTLYAFRNEIVVITIYYLAYGLKTKLNIFLNVLNLLSISLNYISANQILPKKNINVKNSSLILNFN